MVRVEGRRRREEQLPRLVGGPAPLVGGVEEPLPQELELEMGEPGVVEDLLHLRRRARLEDVLEVRVPEAGAAEADAGRVLAAVAEVEEAPLPPDMHLDRARDGPVEPEQVVAGRHCEGNHTRVRSALPSGSTRSRSRSKLFASTPSGGVSIVADYVIVGAGSAGCVLAGRLSEDPDVEVLLVEAGGPDTAPEVHIPGVWPIMLKSGLDWDLLGEQEPGLGDRRL